MTQPSTFGPNLHPNAFMLAAMAIWVKAAFQAARHVDIRTSSDLVSAAHILDMMVAAGLFGTDEYCSLIEKAKAFFLATPELRTASWVHRAGAIHDLREEMCDALSSGVDHLSNQHCTH